MKTESIYTATVSLPLGKSSLDDLALFGGPKLFNRPRSTSNLLQPDVEKYLSYSRIFFDAHQFSNNGPVAQMLERRLAAFHDVEHCLVFSSGFWAIALAMRNLALEGKDEVIMPSLTYRRMADIAAWVPLKPHYCEVDPVSLAMTPETVAACINDRTALILGTHPIVNCCDTVGLEALGQEHGIPVVFDSVESVFETVEEGRIGGFGSAECFSLHACKLLNGFGGGYLTTNNGELARTLAASRAFGFSARDYVGLVGGLNAKLNEMHAALALASLDDLDLQVRENQARYHKYRDLLEGHPGIRLLKFDETKQSGFKNIVVELTECWPLPRDVTIRVLNAENVLARAYYAPSLHLKSGHIPHVAGDLSQTERLSEQFLNMPCGQRVDLADISEIISLIHFLEKNSAAVLQRLAEQS